MENERPNNHAWKLPPHQWDSPQNPANSNSLSSHFLLCHSLSPFPYFSSTRFFFLPPKNPSNLPAAPRTPQPLTRQPSNMLPSTLSGKLAPALLFSPQPLPALPLPWQAPQPLCSCISMSGAPNHYYGCSPLHSHAPHAWSFLETGPPLQMSSSGCSPKWRERLKKINISRKPKLKKNGSTPWF